MDEDYHVVTKKGIWVKIMFPRLINCLAIDTATGYKQIKAIYPDSG